MTAQSAAAGGAHLTGTTSVTCPSVFEILSHEGFANALKPAVAHVIKILAERNPAGKFGVGYQYFDELYLVFDAIVQWHYILTRGATLSEAFYGLERRLTTSNQKLTRIRISYLLSVVIPYVSSKLEKFYKSKLDSEALSQHSDTNSLSDKNTSTSIVSSALFFKCYPYFKLLLKVTNILYLLSYTFGYSEHHSLTFRLLRMTLGYTSQERTEFMEEKNAELWRSSEWRNPRKLPKLILRSMGESVLFAVEIGTFFIQFLEWWYNDERRARVTLTSLPVPLAPQSLTVGQAQHLVPLLPSDMNKCPICRKDFKNPTAVSVSGIVYCYGCILPHMRQEPHCPLTRLPCNINHLIRIYQ